MENQQDQMLSETDQSANAAENGSAVTNTQHQSTLDLGKKAQVGTDAPQLHKWVYQTSQGDLTLAENLEKSKWEGECCKCEKKTEEKGE
jgi:hypothetical protein